MYTIRQLIEQCYRISGVKGIGETPTAIETSDALEALNGILDNFGMEQAFRPGIITRTVTAKPDGTIVIANDGSRIASSIVGNGTAATITTAYPHGLAVSTGIVIQGAGVFDGPSSVTAVTSLTSFTISSTSIATVYAGTFKKATESDAYLIDLAIEPPDQVIKVMDGTTPLTEYPSDLYYADRNLGICNGWYFETALDPYATLYLDGPRTVDIVFYQPGYRNVTLNTDTDKWQMGMKESLKWRLASDLAMNNGYLDMSSQCMNRFSEVIAKYRRSHRKVQPHIADTSAPGVCSGARYDISTDTYRG